jgi:hypothetical protein
VPSGATRYNRQAAAAAALAELAAAPQPAWLCIFDARERLQRLELNAAARSLFCVSQPEVDLRVRLRKPLRWLHPDEVLARSAAALRARLARADTAEHSARYLSRRVPGNQALPVSSLLVLAHAMRGGDAAVAASEPAGAQPPQPQPLSDEVILEALDAIDDSLVHVVFCATEHERYSRDGRGALHTVLTRFAVEGVALAARVSADDFLHAENRGSEVDRAFGDLRALCVLAADAVGGRARPPRQVMRPPPSHHSAPVARGLGHAHGRRLDVERLRGRLCLPDQRPR